MRSDAAFWPRRFFWPLRISFRQNGTALRPSLASALAGLAKNSIGWLGHN